MNRATPKVSLDEKIAAAFVSGARSDDVPELIQSAQVASAASDEVARLARERALDPSLGTDDVASARREMEDAAFRRDRMQAAVIKLGERLKELRAEEEDARRWEAYDKAQAERAKLAAELKEVYPAVAARLVDLMSRIEANDREIEKINLRARPSNSEWLYSVELVARDLKTFSDGPSNIPRIVRDIRLPFFEYRGGDVGFAWPKKGK